MIKARRLSFIAVALLLLLLPLRIHADGEVTFTSTDAVIQAIGGASTVTLSAYTLRSDDAIVNALASAARRRAHISVVLTGQGFGYALRQNQAVATILEDAGARVRISSYPLHMKAAIIDGTRVYVSDENFSPSGLVIELPAGARMTVERAILGQASTYAGIFTTSKADSLKLEAAVIRSGIGGPVDVESESFGPSVVADALIQALGAYHGSIVVAANASDVQESTNAQDALGQLREQGADVVLVKATDKLAITRGACWAGSSNASNGLGGQIDFGLSINDPGLCKQLQDRMQRNLDAVGH